MELFLCVTRKRLFDKMQMCADVRRVDPDFLFEVGANTSKVGSKLHAKVSLDHTHRIHNVSRKTGHFSFEYKYFIPIIVL